MLPFLWCKQVTFLWLIPRVIRAPKDGRTREKSWYSQKVSHSQWDCSFFKHLNLVFYFCMCAQSLSCVWLLEAPWTVAHQAPLSMEFSRQKYWSGLPFPSLGYLPDPVIEPVSLASPALAGGFFTSSTTRIYFCIIHKFLGTCRFWTCFSSTKRGSFFFLPWSRLYTKILSPRPDSAKSY